MGTVISRKETTSHAVGSATQPANAIDNKNLKRSRWVRGVMASTFVVGLTAVVASIGPAAYAQPGWTGPILSGMLNPTQRPQQVSCPTATQCMAVDSSGNAAIYTDGIGWTTPFSVTGSNTNELSSVSCVSGSLFCVATGVNTSYVYNGSWSGPTTVFTRSGSYASAVLISVSCATNTFCAAVDQEGDAFTWNGTSWTAYPQITSGYPGAVFLLSVSCSSPTFCVAVDKGGFDIGGYAFDWNGSSWAATTLQTSAIDPTGFVTVSCAPSSTDCVALDHTGTEYTTTNGFTSYSSSVIDSGNNLASVTCPTTTFCMADDEQGNVFVDNSNTWTSQGLVDTLASSDNEPFTLSCDSNSFCVMIEGGQRVYDYSFIYSAEALVSITPSPIPASSGPVTYTVTVNGNTTTGTPTGSVVVTDSLSNTCTISTWNSTTPTSATGSCSLTEDATSPPSSVTANYGPGNYPAASASISVQAAVSNGTSASVTGPPSVTGSGGTSGVDAVTVAQYSSVPVDGLSDGDNYFDVAVTQPSGFTSVVIDDCGVSSTSQLWWWDTGTQMWEPVVGNPGPTYSGGCLTVTLDATTSPTLAELTGTVFGNASGLDITTESIPEALVHYSYSYTLSATGGNAPYHWSLSSGSLPPGLHLNHLTGIISGTPHVSGIYSFTVRIVDHRTPTRPHTQNSFTEAMSLSVTQSPASISYVHPDTGPLSGDTHVTIHGTNFEGATSVTFGGVTAMSFHVNGAGTAISAYSPVGSVPGQVDIQVTTPVGETSPSSSDVFTYG